MLQFDAAFSYIYGRLKICTLGVLTRCALGEQHALLLAVRDFQFRVRQSAKKLLDDQGECLAYHMSPDRFHTYEASAIAIHQESSRVQLLSVGLFIRQSA